MAILTAPGGTSVHATRLGIPAKAEASNLGPLQDLVGTWHGSNGWELIAVPDPEHEFQYAEGTTTLKPFTIDKPGLVAVESHTLDKTIVQLEVK